MKLIYKGKYKGEVEKFSSAEKVKNAQQYVEANDLTELLKKVSIPANILQFIIIVIVFLIVFNSEADNYFQLAIYYILSMFVDFVLLIPHELLHAICYKKDVYLYQNLKQSMLFIVGEDHMSKVMFIFMSLLPNIVFGFIPFILFLVNQDWFFLGFLSIFTIPSGAGDYYNVYNTLKQVPKGAKIFMNGFHSYWYLPKK